MRRAISKIRKNCLDLSGEPIDYSVHGSPCALNNVMPNILGCLHSALRHVGCPVDGASLNAADGDGDGENDRKERFHGTKVFVAARSRAFTRMISVFPFRLRKEFHRL
jgi:hypothetical protein